MSPRQAFLERVKSAVAQGNRAGTAPPLPERGNVGYQGGGADLAERFCKELAAAGGTGHLASDADSVVDRVRGILKTHGARKILLSAGGLVDRLNLGGRLQALGLDISPLSAGGEGPGMRGRPAQEMFAADIGITNVYRLIAETGTVVVASEPNEPRSASLLPPVHIALAERWQILPDLFDLFDLFSPNANEHQALPPSCLSLITGPSKTGDIELKLVTGVHGPGEVHVIVCDG